MEPSAPPLEIIPAETMLVPPMINGPDLSGEDEQHRRQRPEVIYPLLLLHPHPLLHLLRVTPPPPPVHVHHHDAGVEVARPPPLERGGEGGVGPESLRVVAGEVGLAVLRRGEDLTPEVGPPELGDVVDDNDVGVEVDDAPDVVGEDVRHVDPGVVEGLVEGLPDGLGYLVPDPGRVEGVQLEAEEGECGFDEGGDFGVEVDGEEVEGDVLGARGVLEDR